MAGREARYHEGGSPVYLNVYDMSPNNDYSYWCGLGIFHSGIEVYDSEYAFGGHDYPISGIFETKPKDAEALGAPVIPIQFRESILVGYTDMEHADVQGLVDSMGSGRYLGNRYHLLLKNCNHFSSEMCEALTGRTAPGWVNRLAYMAVLLHCLLPKGLVPPLPTPSADPTMQSNPTYAIQDEPPRDAGVMGRGERDTDRLI
mmetsp:Transcript_19494/g.62054  ORF Transcript_19494/g.62054 Transcript_19494/m.62054 type:complete len:202 (-) Transcript_19494:115-720(-)|eukprot:CAMPEP_0182900786 /NCGR_PEP_ID=MMETSP0034_2-20130328/29115_1 /TAXON_ID=156128 /ORGANISM="Nephroselmis pyriformis, Strain CCMP717" /LENGTH=201 /DNA_ID=CAMNT_0025035063 /DNA_START=279 /DNA_END=884 /DNA_ORIENTATION=-